MNPPNDKLSAFDAPFRLGNWRIDPLRSTLTSGETVTHVEPKAMAVLLYLVRRGDLVSKQELIDHVWEGRYVSEDVITVAVYELRKALGDSARNPQFIETIARRGYRVKIAAEPLGAPACAENSGSSRIRRMLLWTRLARAAAVLIATVGITSAWRVPHFSTLEATNAVSTSNEAQTAYREAVLLLNERSRAAARDAMPLLERATALDPDFAAAQAALARTLVFVADGGWGDRVELRARALTAIARAQAAQPHLAEAYAALGMVQLILDWDFVGAERSLLRALQENPDSMEAHQVYAWLLSATARHEQAIAHARRAVWASGSNCNRTMELAWALSYSGRYREALAELDSALERAPRYFEGHISRGMVLELLGDTAGAFAAIRAAYATLPSGATITQHMDAVFAREGLRGVYRSWLRVTQQGRVSTMPRSQFWQASLYSRIGDTEGAVSALERAFDRHEGGLAWLRVEPSFTPLRYDARYQALVQRVGLVN